MFSFGVFRQLWHNGLEVLKTHGAAQANPNILPTIHNVPPSTQWHQQGPPPAATTTAHTHLPPTSKFGVPEFQTSGSLFGASNRQSATKPSPPTSNVGGPKFGVPDLQTSGSLFDAPSNESHSTGSNVDEDMSDAPPSDNSTQPTPPDSSDEGRHNTKGSKSSRQNRRILKPVPAGQRKSKSKPRRDAAYFAKNIHRQADDGTLPKGYSGTHDGMRFYEPEQPEPPKCGSNGHHELVCGHWIFDNTKIGDPGHPCGGNCKIRNFEVAAFTCPTCYKIVEDIIANDLTDEQKKAFETAKSMGPSWEFMVSGYLTEFITRSGKITNGVADIVACMMRPQYGRQCVVGTPFEPVKFVPVHEFLEMIERQKVKTAFHIANGDAQGQKRKSPSYRRNDDEERFGQRTKITGDGDNSNNATWVSAPKEQLGVIVRKRKPAVTDVVLHDREAKRDRLDQVVRS